MRPTRLAPPIPPEARARQARLDQLLGAMVLAAPSREPECLQELRQALADAPGQMPEDWIQRIHSQGLVEEAAELFRSTYRQGNNEPLSESLQLTLAPLAAKAQAKRIFHHHLDTKRITIRFDFSKHPPALELDDRDLQILFLQAFRLEGFIPALDEGKRPRPVFRSPLPLPAGAAGLEECMEVELKREPLASPEELLQRLQRRLPEGLKLHRWEVVPNHASSLAERAVASHWRWSYPPALEASVRPWAEGFNARNQGQEGHIQTLVWEEGALVFSTRAGSFLATNPLKTLAAHLGLAVADVTGLTRVQVELRADARLEKVDRYESKLKNIYEDAVLLGGGSNITLVDEDDDEPIQLG